MSPTTRKKKAATRKKPATRPNPPALLTARRVAKAAALNPEASQCELAELLGCSQATVNRSFELLGIVRTPDGWRQFMRVEQLTHNVFGYKVVVHGYLLAADTEP